MKLELTPKGRRVSRAMIAALLQSVLEAAVRAGAVRDLYVEKDRTRVYLSFNVPRTAEVRIRRRR
jgi:hypothetical protein